MRKTLKVSFELNLEEMQQSAKYAFLVIILCNSIINLFFTLGRIYGETGLTNSTVMYSLSGLLGIIAAFMIWKKVQKLSFAYYAVVCVLLYLIILLASYICSDRLLRFDPGWVEIPYYAFHFIPLVIFRVGMVTHLIVIFLQKRWR